MEGFPYKRVAVIGCPGGGKSTFSRALRDRVGLPLYHLDAIYWKADGTTVSKEEFSERLAEVMATDAWIIDGNYGSTMERRLAACYAVFFLDYPTDICVEGIRSRRGQARSDIPWVETGEDAEFLDFVKRFEAESRPKILVLLAQYPDKAVIIFRSRAESEAYLTAFPSA